MKGQMRRKGKTRRMRGRRRGRKATGKAGRR